MSLSRVSGWTVLAVGIGVSTMALFSSQAPPAGERAQPTPDLPILELVVGDRVPLLAGYDSASAARTQSSNPAIAAIVGKDLVANDTGSVVIATRDSIVASTALRPVATAATVGSISPTVTVTGTAPSPTGNLLTLVLPIAQNIIRVNVRSERQATNMLVSEVCANVDSTYFMMEQPLSSHLPRIHEYHDCQKLIENQRYSAVVGIFASSNVDSTYAASDTTGHLAAIIVSFIGKKELTTYETLKLRPGTTCLVIRSVGRRREAALIPQSEAPRTAGGSPRYGDCPDNLKWSDVPREARRQLVVREQRGVDLQNKPIAPSVGRWDWDPVHKYNYIGVKCAPDVWCEIGPQGFVSSDAATTAARKPIFKGYYDEQYLAEDTLALVPSSVWGTILPGADAITSSQMQGRDTTKWYESATVRLVENRRDKSVAYLRYTAVFSAPVVQSGRAGISPPPPVPGQPTLVPLRVYPIVSVPARPMNVVANAPPPAHTNYLLRPISTQAFWRGYEGMMRTDRVTVQFMSHPGYFKTPTVRWRWKANDEGIWGSCQPDGCCEYSGQ